MIFGLTLSFSSAPDMLEQSWAHYKKQKIAINGRPLADVDYSNLGQGSYGEALTYSESVSYVMYRAVLGNDQKTFDQVWSWAVQNLLRAHMPRVFNWAEKRWREVPTARRDYLFAWRYTPNIMNTGMGGVIYVNDQAQDSDGWRHGLDAAPDGDQLIAGALIMAHNRWGSRSGDQDYLGYARKIVPAIWDKCVLDAGQAVIDSFEKPFAADRWFTYSGSGSLSKTLETENGDQYLSVESWNNDYYGVGKYFGSLDLSSYRGLRFKTRWNPGCDVILEDVSGNKVKVSRSYADGPEFTDVWIDFPRQRSDFNWSAVKVLMFQPAGRYFALDEVVLIPNDDRESGAGFHLLANDRGDPWLNMSYYMPFLYPAFAALDPQHDWQGLMKDCLADIRKSKSITLHNDQGQVFQGNGALVPDWCMLGMDGSFTDLPWARDGKVDDYLSSWDAFRTWYFLGLTEMLYPESGAKELLQDETYEFFARQLRDQNKLLGGYHIDGSAAQIRGVEREYSGQYGAYLAFFSAIGDDALTQKVYDKLRDMYHRAGYWGDNAQDYYKQNWAWLGLELFANKGENIRQLLSVPVQVANNP